MFSSIEKDIKSSEIRKKFLDFFQSKQHSIYASAPITLKDDPTLLFTNAGMNQFKNYFLGYELPTIPRVANTQKCLRVSGKHNDLEEVGVDHYHHTMFEMLGNWSFGNYPIHDQHDIQPYFKQEAIAWSWELLTKIYLLHTDRLFVTVFEGNEGEKLPKDSESFDEWKKWVPNEQHILYGGKKDNFWEMGDTGPCGPCTEIHVDLRSDQDRKKIPAQQLVNTGHPEVIEIWNNVFIQYNRKANGVLEPLPNKHVDTGMGLERLTRILQNKKSNYDTDLFEPLIRATEQICKVSYQGSNSKQDIAFRVIADHIRAIFYCIADGQLPSNVGAGYVVRRILRRAVRYYFQYLNRKESLLTHLVASMKQTVKASYYQEGHLNKNVANAPIVGNFKLLLLPQVKMQQKLDSNHTNAFDTMDLKQLDQLGDFVAKVIHEEEEAFLQTLDRGLKRLDDLMNLSIQTKKINGAQSFELFDTYGFPLDLTKLVAHEQGFDIDELGFEQAMREQKNRGKKDAALVAEDWQVVYQNKTNGRFVGYDTLSKETQVIQYRKLHAKNGDSFHIVLAETPFYAESGGQIGDTGTLFFDDEQVTVLDTKKENNLTIHYIDKLPQKLDVPCLAQVDKLQRRQTTFHHSATHLLQAALKHVLGDHVAQKGSLVTANQLRFDFTHFAKLTPEELKKVEILVNQKIQDNIPVSIQLLPKDDAIKMGATALFGEKYGDTVRVVTIDSKFSIELCGGTHVQETGHLGAFAITSETAIASGVRRITAVCGVAYQHYMREKAQLLDEVTQLFKNPANLLKTVKDIIETNSHFQNQIESYQAKELEQQKTELLTKKTESIGGYSFTGSYIPPNILSNPDQLKHLSYQIQASQKSDFNILVTNINGKAQVAIAISDALQKSKNIDANKIIKEKVASLIGGRGGGQKNLATAGGADMTKDELEEVIKVVKNKFPEIIESK